MLKCGKDQQSRDLEAFARTCVDHANEVTEEFPLPEDQASFLNGLSDLDFDRVEWYTMGARYQRTAWYTRETVPPKAPYPAAPAYAHRQAHTEREVERKILTLTSMLAILVLGVLVGIAIEGYSDILLVRLTHAG